MKVFPPPQRVGSEFQIWIAATGADQAVPAVLDKLGPGWRAERLPNAPTKAEAAKVKLRRGAMPQNAGYGTKAKASRRPLQEHRSQARPPEAYSPFPARP